MITITIPDEIKKISEQIIQACTDGKGLVLIIGANQNWNEYMLYSMLNLFRDKDISVVNNEIIQNGPVKKIVEIGEENVYSSYAQTPTFVKVSDLTHDDVVHGGAIRSKELALEVLEASKICVVVAVIHVLTVDSIFERFVDMEIPKENIENVLRVIIQQDVPITV